MNQFPRNISAPDLAYITEQLGRTPSRILAIAARDAQGKPAVITNHPLQWQGETPVPFPTLYWLIDPRLSAAVSDLERRGAITQLEQQIANDPSLREQVHADHHRYAASRWAMFSKDEKQLAVDHGFVETLRDKGIGGTADFDKLKCLHMHLAYHLAERAMQQPGTAVGQLITNLLAQDIPPTKPSL